MIEKKYSYCRICEAACGLELEIEDNQIKKISPDQGHAISDGYGCIKGFSLDKFVESPDRITKPLKKVGDRFVEISWEQATSEIAAKLASIRERHGGQSIAAFTGNPIGFSFWPMTAMIGFLKAFGSDKLFTVGTLDCTNKFAVTERMYGSYLRHAFPDIDHTEMLIAIGSNPQVSKMSFINLPHPMRRIEAIESRGGRVVWVNPRKTESAKRCGEHLAIRPDTDVFFMLGFLRELIAIGGVDKSRVEQYMEGYSAIEQLVEPWTLTRVEQVTRIPAASLAELVKRYSEADGAALYCSTGINQGSYGSLAFWLQEVINAISGNLDRRGGTLMGLPALDFPDEKDQAVSRIGNTPYIKNTVPFGLLADEILTPGEGQVRALLVMAGNPVLSGVNSNRFERALDQLELTVAIDLFRNETGNKADYILPGLHFLERPDIPFMFIAGMGVMPKRFFAYTDAVLKPRGEARDEGLILRQIASAAGAAMFGSRLLQWAFDLGEKLQGLPGCKDGVAERFYGLLARRSGLGGLKALRRFPRGQRLPDNQPGDYFGGRMQADKWRLQLAPAEFMARAQELEQTFARECGDDGFKLISKRERFSHNSWAHNVEAFVKGERNTNYLYIHPSDAERIGLVAGQFAEISANGQSVTVPVKLDADFMPGTVSVPHGWGHQTADGLSVARDTQGANVNILASDGPSSIEPISGMSQLNGIPVSIRPHAKAV